MLRIANATNGLAFPPFDGVSMFLSTHGHNHKFGYFRIDAMPYSAVIELLRGGSITVVDATQHNKPLPDALRYGLTTWALVFNRAIRVEVEVASWQTKDMWEAAHRHQFHPLVQRIRRLASVYGYTSPAIIGKNILTEVHRNFEYDDKPNLIMGTGA